MNLKRKSKLPPHHFEIIKDICNTIETISYFASDDDEAESDIETTMNVKVMTDTKISTDLLIETIIIPLTTICVKSNTTTWQSV